MTFKKISGILMLVAGFGAIGGSIYGFFYNLKYNDLLDNDILICYGFFLLGCALVYFPYTNIFGTGYINKAGLTKIKNENKLLRLKIEQEKLNKKLKES